MDVDYIMDVQLDYGTIDVCLNSGYFGAIPERFVCITEVDVLLISLF